MMGQSNLPKSFQLPAALLAFLTATLPWGPLLPGQQQAFQRGDANADSSRDLTDAIFTLRHLFLGGEKGPCEDAMDANDDGFLNIADAIHSLGALFLGEPEMPEPASECGLDPTADQLTCDEFLPCGGQGRMVPLLLQVEDCETVMDELRQKLVEEMQKTLDQNLEMALEFIKGDICFVDRAWGGWLSLSPPTAGQGAVTTAANKDQATQYSGTNNQVAGVEEADFVKNDGGYIYILADGQFQIVDAWPAPDARRIAAVDVEGTPRKLFVYQDRAVIYSSLESIYPQPDPLLDPLIWYPGREISECTYGYDCEFTGDGRKLKATVFDITDRTDPRLLREIEFSGSYLSARRMDHLVHTVVIFPKLIVPGVSYWPEEIGNIWDLCWRGPSAPILPTEDEIYEMFARLSDRNAELIEKASLVDLLPVIRDTRYRGEAPEVVENLLQDCRDFFIPQSGDGESLISLVSFELDKLDDPEATTIVGRPGAVYASRDSLYIATRHYRWQMNRWYFGIPEEISEATTIHKFSLPYDDLGSRYVGSGVVKGRVLNQFSMDEHLGYLRVATTTGHVPSPDVHSTLSVLGSGLELVGQVDHIAPNEDIRSVRFDGETGYIVTFKKTDPLFVLDLSEPMDPEIRGELKIPGFSTYLHILDENHLLSIGYDADDQGNFAWFTGIQLQVIDVSILEDPQLVYKEVIGTRGSTSDAATNHLAFNFFRPRDLLAIPMVVCEGGSGGTYGDKMTFSGLMVYRVDVLDGFEYLGGIPHSPAGESGVSCGNWWTRSNSQVKRSIFMDDFAYSVALDEINISRLDDLENPVARVSLKK